MAAPPTATRLVIARLHYYTARFYDDGCFHRRLTASLCPCTRWSCCRRAMTRREWPSASLSFCCIPLRYSRRFNRDGDGLSAK